MEEFVSGRESIVAASEQVSCTLAEEAVILDLKSGVYYGLNPVAARVWDLIQEPKTLQKIRDTILEEYDVDLDRCERDLLTLLRELAARELIRARHEEAS